MEETHLSLEGAKKYRRQLAKKINRARFVSGNKLLKLFFKMDPQDILDSAKATKEYAAARKLSVEHRKEEMKPANRLTTTIKKGLVNVLNDSLEFVEKGKKYYMTMTKYIKNNLEYNNIHAVPEEKFGDVYLTDEYGVVIGKRQYHNEKKGYDGFLHLRGNAPYGIVDKITAELVKI